MKTRAIVLCCVIVLANLAACQAADLPLTRVELFASGVGYFERQGPVDGSATVELSFRTEQINDILKSLVVQDLGGGSIAPVTYAPQEPLERTLSAFAVNIADNPTLRTLWDRLRGTAVRLTVGATPVEGTALGSETREQQIKDVTTTVEYLNLLTHKGLMQFAVPQVTAIKLLDPKLDADLQKALAAIDKARDTDRRPVTLSFKGQGKRTVCLGYLLETPVWKTTYRLVNDQSGLFLQGWALVENTTDDDWNEVGLSLISGRPVSFTQNLYEPLFIGRPSVPVQVAAAARPRVYEGAMESKGEADEERADRVTTGAGMGAAPRRAAKPMAAEGAGMPGSPAMVAGVPMTATPAPAFALRSDNAAAAMAQGGKVGTLFQYAINQPVTIPRQRSAMIPIINQKIEGEKVSVYNTGADARHPMNGIRLKNTSALHLMGGPITVFDGAAYGGDALIEDIPPGDERLLTYAMDLAVEVEPRGEPQADHLLSAKIVHGVMTLTWKNRTETTYNVKSSADEKRTVLIEHPQRSGWDLIEPKQADERTRTVYRFRVPVEPRQTAKLVVIEEAPRVQIVRLTTDDKAPRLYVAQQGISEKLRAALQQIIKLQDELAGIAAQRSERETRIKEIEQEQERIRQNMKELDRNSDLYKQYVTKLTAQETEFEKLRGETKDLRAKEAAKKQEIANFVEGLDIE
jgi:hypothetical protein